MATINPDKILLAAVKLGNISGIESAIQSGANIRCTNAFGESPLHVAVRFGQPECVQKLLLYGANLQAVDHNVGYQPMHTAATYGKISCIKVLIERNKDLVHVTNKRRETPLHLAVWKGHVECVKYLLELGAIVQAKDSIEDTPLHCCVVYGKINCLQTLLEHGASVFVLNGENETPVDTAKEYHLDEVVEILEKYQFQGLFTEIESLGVESVEEFKSMLSKGSYKCYWNRVYLVGPYNVGKTTLAKNMVGDPVPEIRESTDGIWIYLGRAGMDTEDGKWIFLPQGTALNAAVQSMLVTLQITDDGDSLENDTNESQSLHKRKELNEKLDNLNTMHAKNMEEPTELDASTPTPKPEQDSQNELSNNNKLTEGLKTVLIKEKNVDIKEQETEKKNKKAAVTNEEIMNLVLEACKKGEYKMKIVPIDLWDFGGQKIYYMTHQLFISSRGTFVIVFNGSVDIYKELTDLSYLPGYFGNRTIAVYLMHWVNSILTYCRTSKTGFPKILFVATHKDLIKKGKIEEQREQLTASVENLFENHGGRVHLHIRPLIFVNARDENDPEVNDLRKVLVDTAFSHPRWGEPMPTLFVPLELQLAEKVKQGTKIMPKRELEVLNANNGTMALTETQLNTFLKVQHSLGRFIYFDEGNLKDYVVIDPTYLIEVLRSVVTEEQFWPTDRDLRQIFMDLKEKGLIRKVDLLLLWEQKEFSHILPYKDFMIEILIHLDIIIEPRSNIGAEVDETSEADKFFLVPCMIKNPDNTQVVKPENSIFLSYTFIEEIIPPAFMYRFLGAFISMWKMKAMFTDSAIATVDRYHELMIHVDGNRLVVSLMHSQNVDDIVPTIASTVQESLTRVIVGFSQFYWSASDSDDINSETEKKKTVVEFSESRETDHSRRQRRIIPYRIDFGVHCSSGLCFFNHYLATEVTDYQWRCPKHKCQHDTSRVKLWFAEKGRQYTRKDEDLVCATDCPGLGKLECERTPSDQQLGRLAASLPLSTVKDLLFQLGLKNEKLEELDRDYPNTADLKFFALWEWKRSNSNPTFEQLKRAFIDMEHNHHKLCEVFRDLDTQDFHVETLSNIPDDQLLENLSNNIGKDIIQLGIELQIKGTELQRIAFRYKTKLMEQTREILREWKRRKQSCYCLAKAFHRIGKLGLFKQCNQSLQ